VTLTLLHCAAIGLTPWCYGGAFDSLRYGLASALLMTTGAWLLKQPDCGSRTLWPVSGLMGWGLLQTITSVSSVSTAESAIVMAAMLAVVLFWSHEGRNEAAVPRLAYAVLVGCASQAIFGVVQAAVAPGKIYGAHSPHIASPFGSFENHNHFAGLMEMAALVALALALGRAKRKGEIDPRSIGFAGLSLALAGAHLASRSRGGLLALVVGGGVLVVLWRFALARKALGRRDGVVSALMLGALLLFAWMAVPASTRGHLATAFHGPTDASGSYRIAIAGATLRLWREHPMFGSGLGTFADEVTRFKRSDGLVRADHAESDALELLAEGGLVGLALFGWLGVAVVRGFLDRVREGHDPWRKAFAVGAMAAVVAVLAHSFLDFNLRIPSNALVFSALVGLASAPRTDPPRFPLFARRLLAVAFTVFGVAAAWRAVGAVELRRAQGSTNAPNKLARLSAVLWRHPYLAEAWRERSHTRWGLARGAPEIAMHRLQGAVDDMHQVLRLRPHMSYAWADLGWLNHMSGDVNANKADEAISRAANLDPSDVAIGLARTEFFARTARLEEARQELRRIRRYNLEWPDAAAESVAHRWGLGSLK
jgi:O-antigen ligase